MRCPRSGDRTRAAVEVFVLFEWQLRYLHVPLVTSLIASLGAAIEEKLLSTLETKIGDGSGASLTFAIRGHPFG
jgi:uncharacterized protein (DUF486 family)